MYRFNFAPVLEQSDLILKAMGMTLLITAVSMVLAGILGLLVAVCRLSQSRVLATLAHGYVQLFREAKLTSFANRVQHGSFHHVLISSLAKPPLQQPRESSDDQDQADVDDAACGVELERTKGLAGADADEAHQIRDSDHRDER